MVVRITTRKKNRNRNECHKFFVVFLDKPNISKKESDKTLNRMLINFALKIELICMQILVWVMQIFFVFRNKLIFLTMLCSFQLN